MHRKCVGLHTFFYKRSIDLITWISDTGYMTKYKITAYGKLGQELKTKVVDVKPTFKILNRFANRVSMSYGAHPRVTVQEIVLT